MQVRTNAAMRLLVLITAWYYFALWGLVANKGLYARRRFGLGSRETAAQLSTFGLASTLSQGAGLRVARRWLSDAQIARRCFGFAVLSQLIYGGRSTAKRSTPVPPQVLRAAPRGSGWLHTPPRKRARHCASSHCLECSSPPHRQSPTPPPLSQQAWPRRHGCSTPQWRCSA